MRDQINEPVIKHFDSVIEYLNRVMVMSEYRGETILADFEANLRFKKVVRLEGFEPSTTGFEDRCSIH